ncbi:hypothetical protein F5884DRAFT_858938 [Xylogone sp. PMI_703]|nr:hypothetical protein F5884DRAFT_858938 [Xylogone sp. PMI_703]
MPHAVEINQHYRATRSPKTRTSSSRELQQLHLLYKEARNRYLESNLYLSIARLLASKNRPAVTKIISLGLGSLRSPDQSRRIKQLTIFLAIAEQLRQYEPEIEIYAQDPSFSKIDEAFLQSLGVHILSTPSATELGEAANYTDESTLVYCPFLTLDAYQLFFSTGAVNFFIGDDFDALRIKWPKHSAGRNEAESLLRRFVQQFRKRIITSDDRFWDPGDKSFPMALYWRGPHQYQGKQLQAML